MAKKFPILNKKLITPFEKDETSSWNEYPRPSLQRDSYICLNGAWDFSVKKNDKVKDLGSINVPFTPESRLSGIKHVKKDGEAYIYKRVLNLDSKFIKGKVFLNFGAVDQICRLYVNENYVGEHVGGYLPFSFDITDYVNEGKNKLKLVVFDELDKELPYGKQRKNRGGMWYTPISGIWQTVWCESVPQDYIKGIRITPRLDGALIEVDAGEGEKVLTLGNKRYKFSGNSIDLKLDDPIHWTPDNPHLYEFTLAYGKDKVKSYFACRTIGIRKINGASFICLNDKPILCHGLLDQGYYSDGIYLPATPEGYRFDILKMKELGFNMLRKHIKIEPEHFYYYCDKYGMLVFQDMVNSGNYSYFVDTVLPFIGVQKGIKHKATPRRAEIFERDARATIDLLYNHPSVVYYTIFNEGWGQYEADRNYTELKAYDPSRIYDATSGWFREKKSDVDSYHVYKKDIKLKNSPNRPLVLSEFGGYSCKIMKNSYNLDDTYGYSDNFNTEDLEAKFIEVYDKQVIPHIRKAGLCALVYTQVSDVEDETNGLLTYDRQVLKVRVQAMKELSDRLNKVFNETVNNFKI